MQFDEFDDETYQRLLDAVEKVDEQIHDLNEATASVLEDLPGYVSPEQSLPLQQRVVQDITRRRQQNTFSD